MISKADLCGIDAGSLRLAVGHESSACVFEEETDVKVRRADVA